MGSPRLKKNGKPAAGFQGFLTGLSIDDRPRRPSDSQSDRMRSFALQGRQRKHRLGRRSLGRQSHLDREDVEESEEALLAFAPQPYASRVSVE